MKLFNKNEVMIRSKKDGVTGKIIHHVMVKVNNKEVCHSSFYDIKAATELKNEITE